MSEDIEALQARLSLLVPINNLEPTQQEQVLKAAEILDLKKKDFVFQQGDRDGWTFYVLEGEVELFADDQLIKRVVGGEGASFHALAQLQPRQMSAQARSRRVKVLRLDRGLLDRLLSIESAPSSNAPDIEVEEIDSSASGHWLTEMLQSELFARIPPSNIQKLLETLETVEFKAGDIVIEQGAPGDYYYAIQTGSCEVLRATKNQKPIKLADLGPGARFGEEALVSNATRNATVKMVTDGELARLTKENFIELIKTPVMHSCSLDEGRALVADGARWLDVRFPEETAANGMEDCINIPLSSLRGKLQELDQEARYVAYCDTGGRSSAAAFLLTQEGYEVSYVDGGAIDEVPPEQAAKAAAEPAAPQAEPAPAERNEPEVSEETKEIVEAETKAQSLAADLEKANLQIEAAKKLMAEAEAAKREADRLVEEKLQAERAKLGQEAAAVQEQLAEAKREADRLVEEKLREERAKLGEEAAVVEERLAEAQKIKDEIQKQQMLAAKQAEQQHQEQEEKNAELKRQAESRLKEEEARIEDMYRQHAEKLAKLESEREQALSELEQAWDAIETESTLSKERLEAAKELEEELHRREESRKQELEEHETRMREQLQAELETERAKLESEFARTAEEIERAQREQEAARAAKKAAAEEAQQIIEEFKENQQRIQEDQTKALLAERQRIQEDAERLKAELRAAAAARAEAEDLKREVEIQLATSRDKDTTINTTEATLRAEIEAIEQRAREATERLKHAIAAENDAEEAQRENEEKLERTYGTEQEINLLLQKELDDWVSEQERLQASTARRDEIEKQKQQMERIKSRAVEAQRDSVQHDANLLDEIAAQLGADD